MKTFEELYISLSEIKFEKGSKEAKKIISEFYKNFKELKKQDSEKFQKKNNFKEIVQSFEKSIFDLDDKKEDLSFLDPIFLLLDFSKNNSFIPKMHFSALGKSFDNYLLLMESEDLTKKISDYFFDNIDFLKLEDFSFFSRNLFIDDIKRNILKNKINNKIEHLKKPYNREKILKLIKLINFLKLENSFDFKNIIKIIIEINLTDIFYDNFKKNKKICLQLLKKLEVGKNSKIMSRIIKSFNLDFNKYPYLIKHQKTLTYNFLYKKFDILKLEDKAALEKDDFLTLLYFLERKKLKNEAFSFYERNKDKFLLNIEKYEKKHNFSFIPNLFIKNDFFGPASILLKKQEKFITLQNLGYKKNDVIIVNSNNLDNHLEKILNSEKIGFDCEFYSENCSNFSEQKLALFQLAIKNNVFLFDCIDILQNSQKKDIFINFFKNLLKENKIIKIGHSFHGDIRMFENTFKIKIEEINNLINIETIYTHKGMALSKITKNIFDLEMCKYEQISSWQRRPLRGTQIHYAALDAAILCEIYEKVLEENSRLKVYEKDDDETWDDDNYDDKINDENNFGHKKNNNNGGLKKNHKMNNGKKNVSNGYVKKNGNSEYVKKNDNSEYVKKNDNSENVKKVDSKRNKKFFFDFYLKDLYERISRKGFNCFLLTKKNNIRETISMFGKNQDCIFITYEMKYKKMNFDFTVEILKNKKLRKNISYFFKKFGEKREKKNIYIKKDKETNSYYYDKNEMIDYIKKKENNNYIKKDDLVDYIKKENNIFLKTEENQYIKKETQKKEI